MSTRHARIADKELNDKHTKILTALLNQDDNSYCADCRKKDPRWASWNLGIFICIRCSGIHRSLGTHISKVKSVDLDTWTPEQIESMNRWGNRRARKYWEAEIGNGEPTDSNIDAWIKAKYEHKKWVQKQERPISLNNNQEKEQLAKEQLGKEQLGKEQLAKEQLAKEKLAKELPLIVNQEKEHISIKEKTIQSSHNDNGGSTKSAAKPTPDESIPELSKASLSSLQSQFSQLAMSNAQSNNMIPKAPPGSDMSWTNFLVSDKPRDSSNILSEPSKEKPLISFDALASLLKQ